MSSHKPDIHHLDLKQYKYYQSVLIPFNVEYNFIAAINVRLILKFEEKQTDMKRREAFKMFLKPGMEQEYQRRHAAIWPTSWRSTPTILRSPYL